MICFLAVMETEQDTFPFHANMELAAEEDVGRLRMAKNLSKGELK